MKIEFEKGSGRIKNILSSKIWQKTDRFVEFYEYYTHSFFRAVFDFSRSVYRFIVIPDEFQEARECGKTFCLRNEWR